MRGWILAALLLAAPATCSASPLYVLNEAEVARLEKFVVIRGSTLRKELARISWWHAQCHGRQIGYTKGRGTFEVLPGSWTQQTPDGRTRWISRGPFTPEHFCEIWIHEDFHYYGEPGVPQKVINPRDTNWNRHSRDVRSICARAPMNRDIFTRFQPDGRGGQLWFGCLPVEWNSLRNMHWGK